MDTAAAPTAPNTRTIMFIIALAAFMGSLDSSIVNISLPTISEYFHVSISNVSWVVMAYLLIICSFLLIFGRLGDMKGFKNVFIAGFAIFTIGSFLCGMSMTIGHLIGFRVLQAVGAAALEAIGPAMIAIYLPQAMRGRALGVLATAVSLGIAAGPIIGGLLTEYASWHWIFFINIPVGIAAIVIGRVVLPDVRAPPTQVRFDIPGALFIFAALMLLIYPLNEGYRFGWTSPVVLGCFAASIVFWALFIVRERRCADPLIHLDLFANRSFTFANLAGLLIMLAYGGLEFLLPFYLEGVQGIATDVAGLILAVPAVALMIVGPIAGSLSDRYGSRWLSTGAVLLTAAAFFLFTGIGTGTTIAFLIVSLALVGVGVALFFPPNMNLILGQSPGDAQGVASSAMMTLRNIGSVMGVALFATVFLQVVFSTAAITETTTYADISSSVMIAGFQAAFLGGVVACIVALLLSAVARDRVAAETPQQTPVTAS